jgi:hypothetical protein
VFDALTSRELPPIGNILDALGPAVSSGHIKFVSFDEKAEQLFVRTGLAGAWKVSPGADWLSIRTANMLSNKVDYFVRRSSTVETTVDPDTGEVTSVVTVTLRNDAPAFGLPDYVLGSQGQYPNGTTKDALTVYTPHTLTALTVDGVNAPAEAQIGYGGNIYIAPVVVPPGATSTIVFTLKGKIEPGPDYRLDVLMQPLATEERMLITLGEPNGPAPTTLFDGPLVENLQLAAIGS